ncbi:AraC family transcriptional regulator [Sphingopyxis sp.]|jgi:AraC-like DNA-binding protein|uniref:AraC family transcriptional regulator n=1 Tax=Sphingopyxis sp. TaxID=1908224 RepID=UPI002DE1FD8D|nr:AraC family transcriptional regulator [Sphingopyxis sp.]
MSPTLTKPRLENVHAEDGSSFRYIHKACDDLARDHPWHYHPEFELSWVMSSHGTRYVGDYVRPYGPNEVVLYGPNLPHCSRNDGGEGEVVEQITVQFDLAFLGEAFLGMAEAAAIRRLLDESRSALMFAPGTAERIGPLMIELEHLSGMSKLIKLLEVLDRLSRISRRALTTPRYLDRVVVDQRLVDRLTLVQRYIDQRYRGTVSQAEISERLEMSAQAFSKFVRSATGNTFMGLVKLARITEACRQLANSTDRITDIALDCGYQHTSHFDRHFLELKGMSPSDYRRKFQQLAATQSDAQMDGEIKLASAN